MINSNKISVSIEDLNDNIHEIASKISVTEFKPSCVLYVDRAGKYIGYQLSQYFNCKFLGIKAARDGSKLKEIIKPVLNKLPERITHFLRRIELRSGIHNIKKNRNIQFINSPPDKKDYILVVDDAVDTGYTILSTIEFLIENGYQRNQILICAIALTNVKAVCKPDIYLFNHALTFPWSSGSRYFRQYEKLVKDIIK